MSDPKSYMDIGHGSPDSILWLFNGERIESRKTGSLTHEKVWGFEAMHYWRGRFSPSTGQISAVSPVLYKGSSIPSWLLDKLEEKFGTGHETWKFNPARRVR